MHADDARNYLCKLSSLKYYHTSISDSLLSVGYTGILAWYICYGAAKLFFNWLFWIAGAQKVIVDVVDSWECELQNIGIPLSAKKSIQRLSSSPQSNRAEILAPYCTPTHTPQDDLFTMALSLPSTDVYMRPLPVVKKGKSKDAVDVCVIVKLSMLYWILHADTATDLLQ